MAEQDLSNTIADNAAGPKRAQNETGSVERHSIQDQIAADKYLASKAASKRADRGLRMTRMTLPGAREQG